MSSRTGPSRALPAWLAEQARREPSPEEQLRDALVAGGFTSDDVRAIVQRLERGERLAGSTVRRVCDCPACTRRVVAGYRDRAYPAPCTKAIRLSDVKGSPPHPTAFQAAADTVRAELAEADASARCIVDPNCRCSRCAQ